MNKEEEVTSGEVKTDASKEQIIFAPKAEDMYYCEKCDSAWWYDDEGVSCMGVRYHICVKKMW